MDPWSTGPVPVVFRRRYREENSRSPRNKPHGERCLRRSGRGHGCGGTADFLARIGPRGLDPQENEAGDTGTEAGGNAMSVRSYPVSAVDGAIRITHHTK
jgi:hypothetical protein